MLEGGKGEGEGLNPLNPSVKYLIRATALVWTCVVNNNNVLKVHYAHYFFIMQRTITAVLVHDPAHDYNIYALS